MQENTHQHAGESSTSHSLHYTYRLHLPSIRSDFPRPLRHQKQGCKPRVDCVAWKIAIRLKMPLWRIAQDKSNEATIAIGRE